MSSYKPWANFEREVTNDLKDIGFKSKRNWDSQFKEKDYRDVIATDGFNEFVLQCKYGGKPNMHQAIKEAKLGVTNKKQIPIGVIRYKGTKDTLAVLNWKDLIKLLTGN